jgi:hypothetical protein
MKYMLLIIGDESQTADRSEEEASGALQAWDEYTKSLVAAGAFVSGEGLQPSTTATLVRVQDGERVLTDGPFAETKEQIGGYYVVDCKNLDEAVDWAARMPSAQQGWITEVRPVMDYGPEYDDPQAVEQQGAAS